MKDEFLKKILLSALTQLQQLFGAKLKSMILYGSYARGDFDKESDIDIMLLVNIDRKDLARYHNPIAELSSKIDLEYDVVISFAIVPYEEFNEYKELLPYYRNVDKEGVRFSA